MQSGPEPDRGAAETESGAGRADMRQVLAGGLHSAADAAARFGLDAGALAAAECDQPVRVNSYFLSLIGSANDPIGRQVIPSEKELADRTGSGDPLAEDADSPVPHLVHRYPDRVLMLVTYQCAIYCRFCTRRWVVGRRPPPTEDELEHAISYIRAHSCIRDVILSGGDPLMLPDTRLEDLLARVRAIPHVEIIRVDTRAPCALPQRLSEATCAMLARFHPLFVNTHFNHPAEMTPVARQACERLANHGIPVGNQTVLLRGVNDDPDVMRDLMHRLLAARVRPYYIYQCDPVRGTEHFRTAVERGIEIIDSLRGHTSGLAVPAYVIDAPGGGGKVQAVPEGVLEMTPERVVIRNYEGKVFEYPQPRDLRGNTPTR